MKNKIIKLLLLIFIFLISLFIVLYIAGYFKDYKKYHIKGNIVKVTITTDSDEIVTTVDTKSIKLLLKNIKKFYTNNFFANHNVDMAYPDYEITYYFDDNSSVTYVYHQYPSYVCKHPLAVFYNAVKKESS